MGPIVNRSVDMHKYIDGFLINPMIYYEISKVAMITESHYAWNTYKYDSEKSFDLALTITLKPSKSNSSFNA